MKLFLLSILLIGGFLFYSYEEKYKKSVENSVEITKKNSDQKRTSEFKPNIYAEITKYFYFSKKKFYKDLPEITGNIIRNEESKNLFDAEEYKMLYMDNLIYSVINGKIKQGLESQKSSIISDEPIFLISLLAEKIRLKDWKEAENIINLCEKKPENAKLLSSENEIFKVIFSIMKYWIEFNNGKKESSLSSLESLAKKANYAGYYLQLALMHNLNGDPTKAKYYLDIISQFIKNSKFSIESNDFIAFLRKIEILILGNFYQKYDYQEDARSLYETDNIYRKISFHSNSDLALNSQEILIKNSNDAIALFIYNTVEVFVGSKTSNILSRKIGLFFAQLANHISDNLIFKLNLSHLKKFNNDLDGAQEILEKIVTNDKIFTSFKNEILADIYVKKELNEQAKSVLEDEIKIFPKILDNYLALVEICIAEKQYDKALNLCDQAIDLAKKENNDNLWYIYLARGELFNKMERFKEAEIDYLESLKLNPENFLSMNNLAYYWLEEGKNLEEAENLLLKAEALNSGDSAISDSLALLYLLKKDYEKALRYAEFAIEKSPNDPMINERLGDIYYGLGEKNAALFQWQDALQSNNNKDQSATERIKSKIKNII